MIDFFRFVSNHWQELLVLTREHIFIVLLSTGSAVLVGVPLGIGLTRIKGLQTPVLGLANIMQTVPSLALFGLLIPIPFVGGIGVRTAIFALALYALLPVIRNTVTGILGVDPKVREAAIAMGMTDWQVLRLVEMPLAAPVILTGIRVAVVIAVGVATVAAAIGAGGLGTYIFRGLRQNDNNLLIAGALAAALLALLCDFALGRIERSYEIGQRSSGRRRVAFAGAGVVFAGVVGLSYLSGHGPASMDLDRANGNTGVLVPSGRPIVVGSKDFTESLILAEIVSQLLERQGALVVRQFELGGNLAHDGLLAGQIDVYPEYTGTAYTAILKHPPITDQQQVYERTKAEYSEKFGLVLSPPLGFANDFAILIRGEVARKQGLRSISDAVPVSRNWQAGFGQDFISRTDGYRGFSKAYGLNFARQPREMDLSLTYRALRSGELDLIAGNSTDGLIDVLDLFQLQDDKHYFPPYEAVLVARRSVWPVLEGIFKKLAGRISTEEMRRMNYEVDGLKKSPRGVAAEWIERVTAEELNN